VPFRRLSYLRRDGQSATQEPPEKAGEECAFANAKPRVTQAPCAGARIGSKLLSNHFEKSPFVNDVAGMWTVDGIA
jgi:hypothetical protein